MIKTNTPPRGSFDHLLTPLRDDAWRDTGFDPPPRRELKEAMPGAPPPTPPEREGGNLRVRVEIEIVERRREPPAGVLKGFSVLWVIIIVTILTIALAHAQPADNHGTFHYQHWQDTNGWHGVTVQQGRTTDWTDYGPKGEQHNCHQYFVGDQPQTNCH